ELVHQRERRDRGDVAGVAAVAASQRAAERVIAVAAVFVAQVDDAHVALDRGALELGHGGRVVDDHGGVIVTLAGAGEGAAQRLDAVFLELEAGGISLAEGQRTGDAQGERRQAGNAVCVLHACTLRWSFFWSSVAAGAPGAPVRHLLPDRAIRGRP